MYASTQWSHSFWTAADFKYQGYGNNCGSDRTLEGFLIGISVLAVVLTTIVLIRAAPKLYQKIALNVKRGNQWYSFFWAASFMASLCNFALLAVEFMGLQLFFDHNICSNPQNSQVMLFVKAMIIYLLIPLDILIAICIPKSEEFPIPSIVYILSYPICCTFCCCRCCCCTCCHHSRKLRLKWIQALALTSLLFFTQFVAFSALPTLLWAFVFPVQTLAAVTFLAAAIFCLTALIAVLIKTLDNLCVAEEATVTVASCNC